MAGKDLSEGAEIEDVPEGFLRDDEVLLLASHRIRSVAAQGRSRLESIESIDPVTADILHGIFAELEKHHWMLQAQRV